MYLLPSTIFSLLECHYSTGMMCYCFWHACGIPSREGIVYIIFFYNNRFIRAIILQFNFPSAVSVHTEIYNLK